MRKFELFTRDGRSPLRASRRALGMALVLGCACQNTQPARGPLLPPLNAPAPSSAVAVARVNGVAIYQGDVERQARAERVPPAEALRTLVTLEALTQRALARRLNVGDEAVQGWRKILVQAYVERLIEPQLQPEQIPDEVLKEVYDRTKDGFMHSRLVRIAIFDLYAFADRDAERRRKAAAWATELPAAVKGKVTLDELRALSLEPKWADRGLKLGVVWQSDKQPYSPAVAKAVMALGDWGETTPVVEDAAGFHLAMYIGERAANQQSFADAKAELRSAIFAPWQQRRFNEITQQLASQAGVTVTPEALFRQALK